MALGIYKPGQGYWVRVFTATLIAVMTLAASAWVVSQMKLVAEKLPRSVWRMTLETGLANPPLAGASVALYVKGSSDVPGVEVGHGVVESYSTQAKELRIKDVTMAAGQPDPGVAQNGTVQFGANSPRLAITGTPVGDPAIEPALLEGLAAAVVLALGAGLAYWATGMFEKFVDFLIATDGEMKKVNWSTAKDIRMSTIVVIFACLTLSMSLFVVDLTFQWVFTKIGVLVH